MPFKVNSIELKLHVSVIAKNLFDSRTMEKYFSKFIPSQKIQKLYINPDCTKSHSNTLAVKRGKKITKHNINQR